MLATSGRPVAFQGSLKPLFLSIQRHPGAFKPLFSSIQWLLEVSEPLFLLIQRLPASPYGLQELREVPGKAPRWPKAGPHALHNFPGTSQRPHRPYFKRLRPPAGTQYMQILLLLTPSKTPGRLPNGSQCPPKSSWN